MGGAIATATDDEVFDYQPDDRPTRSVSPDKLGQLTRLCAEQVKLEDRIAAAEAEVDRLKAQWSDIARRQIPAIAKECGFTRYDVAGGLTLKVKDDLKAKLYEDPAQRAQQIEWLDGHGQAGIVKRQIIVSFAREDAPLARRLLRDLGRRKTPLAAAEKYDVANNTLVAALKEMISDGVDVPFKLFQAFPLKEAKIERPKR